MTKSALLIKMIDLLRARPGITVNEIAADLQRSERTIYRWLSQLTIDLNAPLYCNDGGYYLADDPRTRNIDLSPQELLALSLSLKSSPFVDGSPIARHAKSAWSKIRDSVSSERLESAQDLASMREIAINAPISEVNLSAVQVLEDAVNNHCRVELVYRSQKSHQIKEYTIDPYALVFRRHSWYLIAYCLESDKIIQFKLARVVCVNCTDMKFVLPADFSVDEYFRLSWEAWAGGEPTFVQVKFFASVAHIVSEAKRHPTQITHTQPDGSVIYEVTVSGIEEIAIWIMGFGKDAEVLEPHSLREYVFEHAKGMLAQYTK